MMVNLKWAHTAKIKQDKGQKFPSLVKSKISSRSHSSIITLPGPCSALAHFTVKSTTLLTKSASHSVFQLPKQDSWPSTLRWTSIVFHPISWLAGLVQLFPALNLLEQPWWEVTALLSKATWLSTFIQSNPLLFSRSIPEISPYSALRHCLSQSATASTYRIQISN